MAKWPNHFISGKQFQTGQIWPLKRPNGNPVYNSSGPRSANQKSLGTTELVQSQNLYLFIAILYAKMYRGIRS